MSSSGAPFRKASSSIRGSGTATRSANGTHLAAFRLDRQSVHALRQLRTEGVVDRAVRLDPAFAGKGRCRDADAEMRLAAFLPAGMAAVLLALVDHFQRGGL